MQNWTIPPSVPAVPLQPGQHQYLYPNSTVPNGHPSDLQSVPHFLVPFRICPSPAQHTSTHTHTHTHTLPITLVVPSHLQNHPPPIYVPHVLLPPGTSSCKHGPDVKGPRGRTQEKKTLRLSVHGHPAHRHHIHIPHRSPSRPAPCPLVTRPRAGPTAHLVAVAITVAVAAPAPATAFSPGRRAAVATHPGALCPGPSR